ncbi:DUF2958 domain-containing protein (plasmid) [Alicyclobacillus fastidiosus]|uniref:DUF2958 domain-containing protein n=1 Tax=Alicyclobacillus fastidiosus TaxID=392011 RepID=A0ABY6ZPU0_9BACL|nr:DUF2958 domain-containing protein [Alicyclobacillus fastidiosus]WAH44875.1 DUF2958 domain-containing protein [Alicyclobacillus fastidiosus]GMA65632.1 hypothetical protein GCM10025859_60720 [Alicyclobacillus fastidiosus]GMA65849.1 hypothetical protein GCM10025859_62890 [Alicyclobacillus fastidiosus]
MELWPASLAEITPDLYATEEVESEDKEVVAKFFALGSSLTWYVVEAQKLEFGDVLFFGYVHTGDWNSEWGYFTLKELEQQRYLGGIPRIERDLHFEKKRFGELDLEQ